MSSIIQALPLEKERTLTHTINAFYDNLKEAKG